MPEKIKFMFISSLHKTLFNQVSGHTMDQAPYFEKWLEETNKTIGLSPHDISEAINFFSLHQPAVSEWCKETNRIVYPLDDVMTPHMLPYSTFLWQWCAQKLWENSTATDDMILYNYYDEVLKKIKLPLKNDRLRNDMGECWYRILQNRYILFPFK